jgi:hypothetical protein
LAKRLFAPQEAGALTGTDKTLGIELSSVAMLSLSAAKLASDKA